MSSSGLELKPGPSTARYRSPVSEGTRNSSIDRTELELLLMNEVRAAVETSDDETLEEKVLEKLDVFLKSLEAKLDRFENYFVRNPKLPDNRGNIEDLYKGLLSVKSSLLKVSNLESLSSVFDDYYGSLLPSGLNTQNIHEKALMGLHYLDAKMDQVEKSLNIGPSPAEKLTGLKTKIYNYETAVRVGAERLLHCYELPFQWRENKFIIYGYRFNHKHVHAAKSFCGLHNETTNIWTHVLGAILVGYLALVHFPSTTVYARSTTLDLCIVYLFFGAAIKCLLSSIIWHTFNGIANLDQRLRFACVDYAGITVLITASVITTEHLALYYHVIPRTIFITFSSLAGVFGVWFTWSPYFDKPECRTLRILFFVSLAGLGFASFGFLCYFKGVGHATHFYSPILKSLVWYAVGVLFYGLLIPERWRSDVEIEQFEINEETVKQLEEAGTLDDYFKKSPKHTEHSSKFLSLWWVDYILASHNIWHLFVLGGILGHYAAVLDMSATVAMNE
ncbi:unnamed protein product [Kuraishia capsulata CBS 1993]|uniref:Uncharacterized protein n=1 Tax=Kuraishia capsulata CBS 1993 TaxID=1382522 RepID=W6MGT8_9ASCO|nr:uncharacterized protein KUCA_T00001368001 [Kuraishia capsulata CBS 1993]CDK25399.1 unnamed protein product [Kuraishia capsulata CBS 1993]